MSQSNTYNSDIYVTNEDGVEIQVLSLYASINLLGTVQYYIRIEDKEVVEQNLEYVRQKVEEFKNHLNLMITESNALPFTL